MLKSTSVKRQIYKLRNTSCTIDIANALTGRHHATILIYSNIWCTQGITYFLPWKCNELIGVCFTSLLTEVSLLRVIPVTAAATTTTTTFIIIVKNNNNFFYC